MALIGLDALDATVTLSQVSFLIEKYKDLHVIALTQLPRPEEARAAIAAGAVGYLAKSSLTPDLLIESLELALLGGVVAISRNSLLTQLEMDTVLQVSKTASEGGQLPASDASQTDNVVQLSRREQMILKLLMQGASNKLIADELNIAEATVKVQLMSLLRKIRVTNRTQAAMWAHQHGIRS